MESVDCPSTFRTVPRTGVLYVSHRASERGFTYGNPAWSNLGQGAPESGPLPGSPPRLTSIALHEGNREYSPVAGLRSLRQAVADYYNAVYRQGKSSLYKAENVVISSGGRSALTRIAASLGDINMGHVIPDYTAYEELLTIFRAFNPIPIVSDSARACKLEPSVLEMQIESLGLRGILMSNPCNPTGRVMAGHTLRELVDVCRRTGCALILDEFYAHYLYPEDGTVATVSAAAYVEDVNSDPVLVIDGLTKNWRYPGLRIGWTLAPRAIAETLESAGSFLDGGAPHPLQEAAIPLLDPTLAQAEAAAIQQAFRRKRDICVERLNAMGIGTIAPQGTFYCWADLSQLPPSLRHCMDFFEAGLKQNVITVPGVFFDVNPGKRRVHSRFAERCRVSFGPSIDVLERGLDALERTINEVRSS